MKRYKPKKKNCFHKRLFVFIKNILFVCTIGHEMEAIT